MPERQTDILVRNLLDVFNERDAATRLKVIEEIYTSQAIFYEQDASFTGFEKINNRVTEVLQELPPGATFHATGVQTQNHHVARLTWALSAENSPVMASGMDVALLEGNRIAALYIFIDPPQ